MSRHNLAFLFSSLLFVSACNSDVFLHHSGSMPSADKVEQLKIGQTKEEVENLLGSSSVVPTIDNNEWIYMSSTLKKVAFFHPEIIDRNVLTVYFKNDKVSRITKLTEKDGKQITFDTETTKSGGHEDMGFFEKYFAGVGQYMPISPTKEK